MYPVSQAFHDAVANDNEQKALLIFDDCVFTDVDISVDHGIEFHDYFNTEEDISIGQTPSNEISFGLFNDDRLLNDYGFGDFLATLGVFIGSEPYTHYGSVTMITNQATYVGGATYPYMMRNNMALSSQPSFPVVSLLGYDGKVWCFSSDGRHVVYDDATGANITSQNPLNNFMKNKSKTWNGKGMFYNKNSRILFMYEGGTRRRFEFCPLGWFTAERPKAPDVILIDLTCYDWMQKFEKDMPADADLGLTWPSTIGNLFVKMCNYAGVAYKTDSFINSSAVVSKRPEDFDTATMRDVLKWIAEAAGSNARFDRDGKLVMDWLRQTGQVYTANGYSEFNPYWYETKKVTKLYNRDTAEGIDRMRGSGNECYLIQDNPLLKGVS